MDRDDREESQIRLHYGMLVGCVVGVLMSFLAVPRIKSIMDMRDALRKLVKSNKRLKMGRARFRKDIKNVNNAKGKLAEIQSEVAGSTQILKGHYSQLDAAGSALNEGNIKNMEKLKMMRAHFKVHSLSFTTRSVVQ